MRCTLLRIVPSLFQTREFLPRQRLGSSKVSAVFIRFTFNPPLPGSRNFCSDRIFGSHILQAAGYLCWSFGGKCVISSPHHILPDDTGRLWILPLAIQTARYWSLTASTKPQRFALNQPCDFSRTKPTCFPPILGETWPNKRHTVHSRHPDTPRSFRINSKAFVKNRKLQIDVFVAR